jgi:hypothetical protein
VRVLARPVAYSAVVLAAGIALYLVITRARGEVQPEQTRGANGDAERGAASHRQQRITPPVQQSNSHQVHAGREREAGDAAAVPSTVASTAPLPVTIDEALKHNAALAKDLACRDEQARFSMDYQLRLIAGIRDCLAGRTKSTGRISFMLHFDNDPATRRATGTHMEPVSSDLTPEDDAIVLECVRGFHVGSLLLNSEKYNTGNKRHVPSNINLPLEESYIYRMVREGSYAAGTSFGCEVP